MADHAPDTPVTFETQPDRYRHWRVIHEGPVARILMDVLEGEPLRPGYALKLNSYDLGVDLELADILQRIRFEHPEVRCLVITSAKDRVFCAGANIHMLASSTHAFKVNFCKFTNETRLGIEEMSREGGVRSLAACNGTCAGGGYELALACDEILLVDDGNSSVGLPEVPLLGVLPGTGGLTRVTDKRKVRRDRADAFCTLTEGIKGKRAVAWGLVDGVVPRSRFDQEVASRAAALAAAVPTDRVRDGAGVALPPLAPDVTEERWSYRHVEVVLDRPHRVARLTVKGPAGAACPTSHDDLLKAGADLWSLRCFRELDDAVLRLRFNEPTIGLLDLRTSGSRDAVIAHDAALKGLADAGDWLAREVLLLMRRTLKRLELSARTLFAIVEPGSAFAGSLLELALAADRIYMLDAEAVALQLGPVNLGTFPMSNGLSRLEARFWGYPEQLAAAQGAVGTGDLDAHAADALGLCTATPDEIDWEDEVRLAIEERASLSPDALTGMEASLRFPGPETMETKIFARLSAWQNWIFQRPNAVGERGALTLYGKPERPQFDWRRT